METYGHGHGHGHGGIWLDGLCSYAWVQGVVDGTNSSYFNIQLTNMGW
jgi:hypothetical protein